MMWQILKEIKKGAERSERSERCGGGGAIHDWLNLSKR